MSSSSSTGQHREHAHHFDSAAAEFEASKQGMWVFLLTEVLFFAGLFLYYTLLRAKYPEMLHEAHTALNMNMGAFNTLVLICSSLSMALGVSHAARGQNAKSARFLMGTIFLAGVFLVVKYFEYSHKIHEGILPGALFTNTEITHPKAPLFFSLYFVMTGLHGIHVVAGMIAIFWVMRRAMRNEFSPSYYTPVEVVGLYWHFVDLVWIYLFPLLYLVG